MNDYKKRISDIKNRVQNFSSIQTQDNIVKMSFSKIKISPLIIYIIIPIIVLFLLLFIKPSFICIDHIDSDNNIKKKLAFKKLLISTLIIGAIINASVFIYMKKYSHTKI